MIIFIIHRFKDKKQARKTLKSIAKEYSIKFKIVMLNSISGNRWKNKALNAIDQAEAIIIYNRSSCEKSDNAKWEIDKAILSGKEVLEIYPNGEKTDTAEKLKLLYDYKNEFDSCFSSDSEDVLDLYKIMLESSEALIQRRQKTNAFFITALGSLIAISGFLTKSDALRLNTLWVLYGFSIIGMLLCNSWRNLLDNYGKLNKAKYDVILQLEKKLGAQIYNAEWISLGKGLRPEKYRSFTATEKNVPLYFSLLIALATILAITWQISKCIL
ncbi:MAG: hypothetical protein ABIA75_03895 [Candidatus Neomarinimicrobiota bacterium]